MSGVKQVYDYTTAFDGFAARMRASAAATLAHTAGVLAVSKNTIVQADTVTHPGVPRPERAGRALVAARRSRPLAARAAHRYRRHRQRHHAGRPVVRAARRRRQFKGFHGACQPADDSSWTRERLHQQDHGRSLVRRRARRRRWRACNNPEYLSARDHNGHGTHTAGTAAGDYNVPVVVNGNMLGNASGMAPNARLSIYKALWDLGGGRYAPGSSADIVSAIDDATSDGVDVINFSVSGSLTALPIRPRSPSCSRPTPGIFVSAAAGNEGPAASTVNHPSPWLTTVAAGTHDRQFQATVTLGNGATYTGVGVGAAVPSSPVILSTNAGLPRRGRHERPALLLQGLGSQAHPEGFLDPTKVSRQDRGLRSRHQ